ncbi:hypothetical protein [Roseovarius gaetbuli]|uniref:hypothetical protein n=1 Tax=Roseovarius gaetbuli TaxID=1356575 RepID=UPI00111C28CA|nr:hypothetical protein [Roseovarius gaetbuli]
MLCLFLELSGGISGQNDPSPHLCVAAYGVQLTRGLQPLITCRAAPQSARFARLNAETLLAPLKNCRHDDAELGENDNAQVSRRAG